MGTGGEIGKNFYMILWYVTGSTVTDTTWNDYRTHMRRELIIIMNK